MEKPTEPEKDIVRFSDLPDDIVYHIFSILDLQDVARAILFSKRLTNLCISAPNMSIDSRFFEDNEDGNRKRRGFITFVGKLLKKKMQQQCKMGTFNLSWVLRNVVLDDYNIILENEDYRVKAWLRDAARCNFKDFILDIQPRDEHTTLYLYVEEIIRNRVISCGTLQRLLLNLHGKGKLCRFPTAGFEFNALQSLMLRGAGIWDENFGEWLSESCKTLKTLILVELYGIYDLRITIPSLLECQICKCHRDDLSFIKVVGERLQVMEIYWLFNCSMYKKMEISAPNLEHLTLEGGVPNVCCQENFISLQTATLYYQTNPICLGNYEAHPTDKNVLKLLQCVGCAKVLHLCGKFLKVITSTLYNNVVYNVEDLYLNVYRSEEFQVPTIVSFLQRSPNLKSLFISSFFLPSTTVAETGNSFPLKASGYSMQYWESQNLKIVQQLKEVRIELCRRDFEFELVKYLLKHGEALEKMIIDYSPKEFPQPSEIMKEVEKYSTRLVPLLQSAFHHDESRAFFPALVTRYEWRL